MQSFVTVRAKAATCKRRRGLTQRLASRCSSVFMPCVGVLYYGDSAAHGVKASTFVKDIMTRAEYDGFISSQPDNILTVVQVMLTICCAATVCYAAACCQISWQQTE